MENRVTLLTYLKHHCRAAPSVKAIKRAINRKYCTVNGKIETFSSSLVRASDRIVLDPAGLEEEKPQKMSVLYEDDDLWIVDKPAGMVSKNTKYLLVHRLDKETSGVLIYAKKASVLEQMIRLFQEHKVGKRYLAIVNGQMEKMQGEIDAPIGKLSSYDGQTLYGVTPRGKLAKTIWNCLKRNRSASLLDLQLVTGRTHQLRVHLSHLHHPILGDVQYGFSLIGRFHPKRNMLHAHKIALPHPIHGRLLEVQAPIPCDFQEALAQLGLI